MDISRLAEMLRCSQESAQMGGDLQDLPEILRDSATES